LHANSIIAWTVVGIGLVPILGKTIFTIGRRFSRSR
jgi:hypothetical protein